MISRSRIHSLILFAGLAAALACPAWAADGTTLSARAPLDFAAALTAAQKTNAQYMSAVEAENAAQARWWQASLAMGPTGTLQFGYVLDNKPMVTTMEFMGRSQSFEMSTNYYSGQLALTQPIFAGFKLANNLRLANLQLDSARDSRKLAEDQLVLDVTAAYYGLVVAQEMLKVAEELLRQTQDHLAVVRARYKEGSASNYDLLRSEVQLANLKPQLLQARNGLVLARSRLAVTIGTPVDAQTVQAQAMPVAEDALAPQDELSAKALANRPELRNMERSRSMADIGYQMAMASNLPSLAVTGSWTYYDTADQTYPPQGQNLLHSWQVMLGLTWNFWDNFASIPKASEAAAKVRQAEYGRKALEDGIRLEVEANYLNLIAAREMLAAQQKTVEQADLGYRIASQQYAHGMMTNMDVMDAQLALNQAKTNYLQTQYDCVLARVKLKKAVGEPLQ